MTVNSVPIYYGGSKISTDFNDKSFINCHNFNDFESVIEYIMELDKNDDKYLEVLNQPWFIDYNIPESNKLENIKSFLYKIFN